MNATREHCRIRLGSHIRRKYEDRNGNVGKVKRSLPGGKARIRGRVRGMGCEIRGDDHGGLEANKGALGNIASKDRTKKPWPLWIRTVKWHKPHESYQHGENWEGK